MVSLLVVIPIVATGSRPNLREAWTFAAGIIKFGLVVSMLPLILDGAVIEYTLVETLPGLDWFPFPEGFLAGLGVPIPDC